MDEYTDLLEKSPAKVCPGCGRNVSSDDKFCSKCGASLAQEKPVKSRNPEKIVFVILSVVLVATLFLAVFFGFCRHTWVEATCEQPRTCSKCEKTEGDALGHHWTDATCTKARHCTVCSIQEGTPAGHTPGEEIRQLDPVDGSYRIQQHCAVCQQQLSDQYEKLETFVEDDLFFFSPQDFLDRMSAIAKESFPDFRYEFGSEQDTFMVHLIMAGDEGADGTLMFMTEDNTAISQDQLAEPGIWCLSLTDVGSTGEYGVALSSDIIQLLYRTCDPLLSEEDLTDFILVKITSALNSAEGAGMFGYTEKNGLLYEFGHMVFEDLAIENIQVYASDWRQQ